MINTAKMLIRQGSVSQTSPTIFNILEHGTTIRKKKGRIILTCDCDNSSYFGQNNFCIHKCTMIAYLVNKDLDKLLNKLIEDYTGYKENGLTPSVDCILNDLENLKRKK